MTSSSFSESDENRPSAETTPEVYLETLQDLQQQQVELKIEVERIHQDVERFRVFFQTLVSGLVLAILIAFGIAIWYAYRSFSQQQIARQAAEEMTTIQEDLLTQVDQLEGRLQRLERDFPDQVAEVTDEVQSGQSEIRRLRDRLSEVESQIDALGSPDDNATADEDNTN